MKDASDISGLQSALNESAGTLAILWTTFVTFQLYFAITIGSVTHRDLFLESPIRLPLLNVDLPLPGFFVVGPVVLMIIHFYVLLQVIALAFKVDFYNRLLHRQLRTDSSREYFRQRLNSFFILQMLAGPVDQRSGLIGAVIKLIAWLTIAFSPVAVLVQCQVTFLPIHNQPILWLQRLLILIDMAAVWYFWLRMRQIAKPSPVNIFAGASAGLATLCVVLFSLCIATFPGEWVNDDLPHFRVFPSKWFPRHWTKDNWTSLHDLLFAGTVDEISGKPTSLFSNRLVVTRQSFVDSDKLAKIDISLSFRGRDLRGAVLVGADLRKADFTGALLDEADFAESKLESARFHCAENWKDCTSLIGANLAETQLQGAILAGARLRGANLYKAHLQGAVLTDADLKGADLSRSIFAGAYLEETDLRCANISDAEFQGADLHEAELQGAWLGNSNFQGANLEDAGLQGANLAATDFRGASLKGARIWHVRGWAIVSGGTNLPTLQLTHLDKVDFDEPPWSSGSTFAEWHQTIVEKLPSQNQCYDTSFSTIDPAATKAKDIIEDVFREAVQTAQKHADEDEAEEQYAKLIGNLACSPVSQPYVARGLIENDRLEAAGKHIQSIAEQMRKGMVAPQQCPGVRDFTEEDWERLERLLNR
jgi:uncharacterized protein YjbI with pentapeptide repeats